MDDLDYVEMVHRARHSGNLAHDSWESSILAAFAWSGKLNPLGAALIDWMDGFGARQECAAGHLLYREIKRQRIGEQCEPANTAKVALAYYKDARCRKCDGRGVIDQAQTACPFCAGIGRLNPPSGVVYTAYKVIDAAIQWMDSQMRFRMRCAPHPPKEACYRVGLHTDKAEHIPVVGQRTPPKPSCQ